MEQGGSLGGWRASRCSLHCIQVAPCMGSAGQLCARGCAPTPGALLFLWRVLPLGQARHRCPCLLHTAFPTLSCHRPAMLRKSLVTCCNLQRGLALLGVVLLLGSLVSQCTWKRVFCKRCLILTGCFTCVQALATSLWASCTRGVLRTICWGFCCLCSWASAPDPGPCPT